MKLRIEEAKLVNGELVIKAPIWELNSFVKEFKPASYNISVSKDKRSIDANSFCWLLIGKIALAIHESPEDIYRRYMKENGFKTTVTTVKIEYLETEVRDFLKNHLGRSVEIGDNIVEGHATLLKKYGSSDYSRDEMSALIDLIIQDCKALGIEVEDEGNVESLLNEWEEHEKRIRNKS